MATVAWWKRLNELPDDVLEQFDWRRLSEGKLEKKISDWAHPRWEHVGIGPFLVSDSRWLRERPDVLESLRPKPPAPLPIWPGSMKPPPGFRRSPQCEKIAERDRQAREVLRRVKGSGRRRFCCFVMNTAPCCFLLR